MVKVFLGFIILISLLLSPFVSHAQEDSELAQISLENVDSLEPLFRLETPCPIREMAVGADNLIAFTDFYAIYLWDFRTETAPTLIKEYPDNIVYDLLFFRDGKTLISGADDKIEFWDTTTGELLTSIQTPAGISSLALDPEEQILAVGHFTGDVTLWDMASGEQISLLRGFFIWSVSDMAFGASSDELFAVNLRVVVWNTNTRQFGELPDYPAVTTTEEMNYDSAVSMIVFNPTKNLLGINKESGWNYLLNLETGVFTKLEQIDYIFGSGIAISPDGSIFAANASNAFTAEEEGFIFWSTETGKKIYTRELATGGYIAFTPNGTLLVTSGPKGVITVWGVPQATGN